MKSYDLFRRWIERLKRGFIEQRQYVGFPELPDCWLEGFDIYKNASDKEKELIMQAIISQFTEALRHWVPEKDALFPRDHNPYSKDDLRHYLKQGWNNFWD